MTAGETPWWQGAVIYQIYPRSFMDLSGDGVGDLRGIAERLDYVARLGVDAIWISPFQKSPMRDFGYDIEDMKAVDPLFGTLDDVKQVIDRAHDMGLKIMMDQVLSHTSDRHPWFRESRASRDNPKADWYVWADPRPDGTPPNNWLSMFGGPSWHWEPRRNQYYLHNFLTSQPDLNCRNPEVQDALLEMCRFWFDMGIDGFRLDVCPFYIHDRELRDNPPAAKPVDGTRMNFNPYFFQDHIYDIRRPETLAFIERLRALADEFGDRALLGELDEREGADLHRAYTAPGRLQLAYGSWLLWADHMDGAVVRGLAEMLGHGADDGHPCWSIDNHDFMRSPTRLHQGHNHPGFTITLQVALSCLRGAVCLYQGSELALPEADIPLERMRDPYGVEFYPAFKGRDGARAPMPWEAAGEHGGFSRVEPWLPLPDDYRNHAVDTQDFKPGSPLNRMRQFLDWRKRHPVFRTGRMTFHDGPPALLAFERRNDQGGVLCLFNLGDEAISVPVAGLPMGQDLSGHGFGGVRRDGLLLLEPWGAHFAALA